MHDLIERGGPDQEPIDPTGPWQHPRRRGERLARRRRDLHGVPRPRGSTQKIDLIQDSFGGAELQVVLTARDLARNIPAMWLESVQNGSAIDLAGFLDAVAHRGQPVAGPRAQLLEPPGRRRDGPRWSRRGRPRPLHPDDGARPKRAPHAAVGAVRAGRCGIDPGALRPSTCAPTRRSALATAHGDAPAQRAPGRDGRRRRPQVLRPATSSTPWPSAALVSRQGDEPVLGFDEPLGDHARRRTRSSGCAGWACGSSATSTSCCRSRSRACTPTTSTSERAARRRDRRPGPDVREWSESSGSAGGRATGAGGAGAAARGRLVIRRLTRSSSSAGPLPTVAAITMARDEGPMLRRWVDHYGARARRENLVVIDDNSVRRHHRRPALPGDPHPADHEEVVRAGPDGAAQRAVGRSLLDVYDAVIFCDADEFIVADPARFDESSRHFVADRADREAARRGRAQRRARRRSEPPLARTASRSSASVAREVPAADVQARLKWEPAAWALASHGIMCPFEVDPELFMFHMKFADRDQLRAISAARNAAWQEDKRADGTSWTLGADESVEVLDRLWDDVDLDAVKPFEVAPQAAAGDHRGAPRRLLAGRGSGPGDRDAETPADGHPRALPRSRLGCDTCGLLPPQAKEPDMADKVVLHVGLMKSGTTFIQRQLFAHQSTLRERGTLVPGTSGPSRSRPSRT